MDAGGATEVKRQDQEKLFSANDQGLDSGWPEPLASYQRHFSRSKEVEIEEICNAHFQEFLGALDDRLSLPSDVNSLKSVLADCDAALQFPLLAALEVNLESRSVATNLSTALNAVLARSNKHLAPEHRYLALGAAAERDSLPSAPARYHPQHAPEPDPCCPPPL